MNRGATGKLGFFFFVALLVVLYGTLIVGNIKIPFISEPPVSIRIHFPSVTGLRKGDDVRVDGVLFGKVEEIRLDPKGGVLVSAELEEKVDLYKDARIYVESSSVLGGTMVAIFRGSEPPLLDLGQPLPGRVRPGLEVIPEKFENIEPPLREALQEIRDLVKGVNEGKGTIGQLVTNPKLHDELTAAVQDARLAIGDAREAVGKIKDVSETVQKAAEKIEKGEGPLPALLNDRQMTEKLQKTLDSVQETADNLKATTERINKGDGTLGKLLNDEEMGDSFKNTVQSVEKSAKSLENITARIEKGPGTVHKLIQDPELYDRAKETIEDLDKVIGKAARAVVEIVGESKFYDDSSVMISKLGLRIRLSDARDFKGDMLEDKYFHLGAAFLSLDKEGDILFKNLVEDNENDTVIKPEILLSYRIPWFLDRRLSVRVGVIEGKPGGGVDCLWENWLVCKWPIQFSFEIRDAYNDLDDEDIDEQLDGPLMRVYAKMPIWTRKDGWLGTLLSTIRVYGGVSRIGDDPEAMVGVGLEWPDDDIRSFVALLGVAR